MEFGIFNLMGSRIRKADSGSFCRGYGADAACRRLGYAIAWFAEHHFSNYCLCASPLMRLRTAPRSPKRSGSAPRSLSYRSTTRRGSRPRSQPPTRCRTVA